MAQETRRCRNEFATTATLLDGSSVVIRCLRSSDYDAVVELETSLSEQERYLRFFTAHPAGVGEWALSLTAPAGGIVAVGAFEADELIGLANYAKCAQRPGYAEIAAVVAHDQHARGVGTALLRELGHIARSAGQHHFVAEVLAENYEMRRVISDAGWPVSTDRDGPVLSVDVDLDRVDQSSWSVVSPHI